MKKQTKTYIYDTEVFPNKTIIVLHDVATGKRARLIGAAKIQQTMRSLIKKYSIILVGFNNFHYDDLILRCALQSGSDEACHKRSTRIINSDQLPRDLFSEQYSDTPWHRSVDLFACLNKKGSLKEHECRLGLPQVAECPVSFEQPLHDDDVLRVLEYCEHDVDATVALFNDLKALIKMRTLLIKKFNLQQWAYCSTEPQLAQQCLLAAHKKQTGLTNREVRALAENSPANKYRGGKVWDLLPEPIAPLELRQRRSLLDNLRQADTVADDADGVRFSLSSQWVNFPEPQPLGDLFVQVGVGGLHSVDAPGTFTAKNGTRIIDLDVVSYYPSIIINRKLAPSQLSESFLTTYTRLRDDRLAAKKAGDKTLSDALKIVINSTFGKLNDVYSPLRSITCALSVTLTGQYRLIELISMLQAAGVQVISANTDGVTCLVKDDTYKQVAKTWEKLSGFELEETEYTTYARRDVNNYIAETISGKIKKKGVFENPKNTMPIVAHAAIEKILHRTPCLDTVKSCTDVRKFLCFARVKNGGTVLYGETELGKVARWYVAKSGDTIRRKNPSQTLDKLPHGGNAQLALSLLSGTPTDIDYNYYAAEADKIASSVVAP